MVFPELMSIKILGRINPNPFGQKQIHVEPQQICLHVNYQTLQQATPNLAAGGNV